MNDWTKARVESDVRDRRTARSWRRWKKPERQMDDMCDAVVNCPSNKTPRSVAVEPMSSVDDDVLVTTGT